MEPRVRYIVVGLFALLTGLAGLGFILWIQNKGSLRGRSELIVRFESAAPGLRTGAPVTFNGVRVGEVRRLAFDKTNLNAVDAYLAIDRAALQAIGWSNPDQFLAPPSAQAAPPPEMQKQIAEMQVKKQQADAQTLKAQADMLRAQHDASAPHAQGQVDTPVDMMTAKAKLMDAQTKRHALGIQQADVAQEDRNRAADRASHEKIQLLELARDIALHPQAAPIAAPIAKQAEQS